MFAILGTEGTYTAHSFLWWELLFNYVSGFANTQIRREDLLDYLKASKIKKECDENPDDCMWMHAVIYEEKDGQDEEYGYDDYEFEEEDY